MVDVLHDEKSWADVVGESPSPVRFEVVRSGAVGVTYVRAKLTGPSKKRRTADVRFMVDSGALYSVLPEKTWRQLRLEPTRTAEFVLADGTVITRGVAECQFEIGGQTATSPVVLGERDDGALLGAVTLETLGMMLNPLNRELVPMRLMLARRG